MITLNRSTLATPLGDLVAEWDDAALHALNFADSQPTRSAREVLFADVAAPAWLRDPLHAYWEGHVCALQAIPCSTRGTAFQESVWILLRRIPAGETRSYGELAAQIGRPTASRAVGAANGANPISLVVPCHRVIGAHGALTGYAHGLARKQWLLDHERTHVA